MIKIGNEAIYYYHMGIQFLFCSEKCKERFIENPDLYITHSGKPTAEYCKNQIIKQHCLKLSESVNNDTKKSITKALETMRGVKSIHIETNKLDITYDLLQTTLLKIEKCLKKTNRQLSGKFMERIKRFFINYTEETELDNLKQKDSYSCHNPPK